jgi:hypothetical protein
LLEKLKNHEPVEIHLLGSYYDTFKFEDGRYQGQFGYASTDFLVGVAKGLRKDYEIKGVESNELGA